MALDSGKVREFVEKTWDESIVPTLTDYITIPAKSPMFDAQWREHGHIDRAVELLRGWAGSRPIEGLRIEVVRLEGRTPLLFMEAPGTGVDTVLLYGHLDKQPEMVGWAEGTGPWTPLRRGDKLYGRGVGDDGYATFAALTAIQALQEQRARHSRCVVLIEACEESGSHDLPYYVDALKAKLGTPSLVVCLDSGCGNYEQLWGTTSLRGVVGGVLTVEVLTEGVHSGAASGIVPSSFRIVRQILDRLEDARTGEVLPRDFHVEIPRERLAEAREVASVLGAEIYDRFPFLPGGKPVSTDAHELILNNTRSPAPRAFRCRPTAATCCARRRRSSSRSACRPRVTPDARCDASRRSSRRIRRTALASRSRPTARRETAGTRRRPIQSCSSRSIARRRPTSASRRCSPASAGPFPS